MIEHSNESGPCSCATAEREFPHCPLAHGGFSLIEFIGVLAIIAVMAAAVTPVVIRRIDIAARNAESSNLVAISNAIVVQILRSNSIPSEASWAQAAASWMNLPLNNILTNNRGFARAFLIDGSGWLTNVPSSGYFIQNSSGTMLPTNARVMVVSTIARGLPVSTGRPLTYAFNDMWNRQPGTVPSSWTNWPGNGDDVLIQRINLQPLFRRVILFNQLSNTSCSYGINGSTPVPVTPATELNAYFFDGSILQLYTNSTLQLTEIVNKDLSRLYQGMFWSDHPGSGPPSSLQTNMQSVAYGFTSSSSPPNQPSARSDSTYGVATMLLSYMTAYSSWSTMAPCFYYQGAGNNSSAAQAVLMSAVVSCFNNPGIGACADILP